MILRGALFLTQKKLKRVGGHETQELVIDQDDLVCQTVTARRGERDVNQVLRTKTAHHPLEEQHTSLKQEAQ